MDVSKPTIVDIPSIRDPRGSLSVIESPESLPFEIARTYWIYDIPADGERDGHAMMTQSELIVALSGSFDVITTTPDGETHTYHLDRNYRGLYLPPMTWREIDNFTTCSVALVVSSALYDETDYIRSMKQYTEITSVR